MTPAQTSTLSALTRKLKTARIPQDFQALTQALDAGLKGQDTGSSDPARRMGWSLDMAATAVRALVLIQRKHPDTLPRLQRALKLSPVDPTPTGILQNVAEAAGQMNLQRAGQAEPILRRQMHMLRGEDLPRVPKEGWALGRHLLVAAAAALSDATLVEANQPGLAEGAFGKVGRWTEGLTRSADVQPPQPSPRRSGHQGPRLR